MKVPTWAYIIGILMMLFGGCNISKNMQYINSSKLINVYSDVIVKIENKNADSLKNIVADTTHIDSAKLKRIETQKKVLNKVKGMVEIDDFTKKWTKIFGYLGFLVSIIYILGGLFLIVIKKFSLKLVYFALGLNIFFSILKIAVLSNSSSFNLITFSFNFSNTFSIIIDIIFLIIILVMSKDVYYQKQDFESEYH